MRVISKRILFEKARRFPDAVAPVQVWFNTAVGSEWRNLVEVRESFPATDMMGDLAIFNIKGNRYRLIVRVAFAGGRIYIKEFLTHAEYDKGGWRKWL